MPRPPAHLTPAQVQHFLDHHHIVLEDCFPREVADRFVADAFARGHVDPARPETFLQGISFFGKHAGVKRIVDVRDFAPKVFHACADLMGGAERIDEPYVWGDGFVVNFPSPAGTPWSPPDHTRGAWHIDGDFNHFLDSPEIGLFVLAIWKDIAPRGGGTAVALDSVGPVARRMLEHPKGLSAVGFKDNLNQQCKRFVHIEGKAGTVYLMHPFMLHSVTQNLSNTPRVISNPHPRLNEPMCLNRENPDNFSIVERATLRALGVDRLDLHVHPEWRHPTDHDTGERRPVPPRPTREERMSKITG
ncbi:MAG: hypothetical protein NTW19_05265 [Planctomycetota bacterium]|nr:hypothetical protein [Planctomycetota bacterium]